MLQLCSCDLCSSGLSSLLAAIQFQREVRRGRRGRRQKRDNKIFNCLVNIFRNPVSILRSLGNASGPSYAAIITAITSVNSEFPFRKKSEKPKSPNLPEDVIMSGSPYVVMVELTDYRTVCDVSATYDVYVITKQLHWLVLVRMQDSSLPYLTFEVTTLNYIDCIPTMRRMSEPTASMSTTKLNGNITVPLLTAKPKLIGTHQGRLRDLCKLADKVLLDSGPYNLLTNNCQHFVNNFLNRLGLEMCATTIGPRVSILTSKQDTEFDDLMLLKK